MATLEGDLLERASRILERDGRTRGTLLSELEATVEELDREFPDGAPEDVQSRIRHNLLRMRLVTLRLELRTAVDRRPALHVVEGERRDG